MMEHIYIELIISLIKYYFLINLFIFVLCANINKDNYVFTNSSLFFYVISSSKFYALNHEIVCFDGYLGE